MWVLSTCYGFPDTFVSFWIHKTWSYKSTCKDIVAGIRFTFPTLLSIAVYLLWLSSCIGQRSLLLKISFDLASYFEAIYLVYIRIDSWANVLDHWCPLIQGLPFMQGLVTKARKNIDPDVVQYARETEESEGSGSLKDGATLLEVVCTCVQNFQFFFLLLALHTMDHILLLWALDFTELVQKLKWSFCHLQSLYSFSAQLCPGWYFFISL